MRGIKSLQAYKEYQLESRAVTPRRSVEVQESIEWLGWLMDDLFRIPGIGWRFGLDALIGLVPGLGDTATSLVSFYILAAGVRYRVPKITLLRMGTNIALDYALGSLPLVGDLFDAWWKSNQKNIALLKERAAVSAENARAGRVSDWLFVGLIMVVLVGIAVGAGLVSLWILLLIAQQFAR